MHCIGKIIKIMGFSCCVPLCGNTTSNSKHKFYRFSTAIHKLNQRAKWISNIRRENADGSTWYPLSYDRICSAHFVGNAKNDAEVSPSYAPTIFHPKYKFTKMNEEAAIKRHQRFMQRRLRMNECHSLEKSVDKKMQIILDDEVNPDDIEANEIIVRPTYHDVECQVDDSLFLQEAFRRVDPGKLLVCNKFTTVTIDKVTMESTVINQAEIQTDIVLAKAIIIPSQKQMHNKSCNTEPKVYVDSSVSVQPSDLGNKARRFEGYSSIKKEEQLVDLAGVSYSTFDFLLDRVPTPADNCTLCKRDRLFIFLMKLKTGLSFSSLGILFCVHRTTVSKIFLSTLQYLASSTVNLVFWPTKAQVQGTMPRCFKPNYSNTRVIIDCTEFRIECPAGVDNRIFAFSHYKKGYTAKILIGVTPGGFISLKSKVNGGRTSDSQLTIESGLLDLLEDGDIVLADKGFPEIRKIIDDSGKSALLVLPPFLEKKTEFSKEETEETYKIASVRIHVERVIQRLRIYHVLDKIPESLFHYMDDLLHVICVLVNLQPPIHAVEKTQEASN